MNSKELGKSLEQLIEDIVDTGHTLHYLIDMLKSRNPASIRTCSLLHKEHKTEVELEKLSRVA